MGLTAKMATETGATVLLCHHMAKIKDNDPPSTPEEARNLIRGTSALVDGVRFAYAVWNVRHAEGEKRSKAIGLEYKRNMFFDGAVVKSNGPADREIRRFVRDMNTGLLVDKTEQINVPATADEERAEAMYLWIRQAELDGRALKQTGDGGFKARSNEPDVPVMLKGWGQTLYDTVWLALEASGRCRKYRLNNSGPEVWIGVEGGPLSRAEYEPITGM